MSCSLGVLARALTTIGRYTFLTATAVVWVGVAVNDGGCSVGIDLEMRFGVLCQVVRPQKLLVTILAMEGSDVQMHRPNMTFQVLQTLELLFTFRTGERFGLVVPISNTKLPTCWFLNHGDSAYRAISRSLLCSKSLICSLKCLLAHFMAQYRRLVLLQLRFHSKQIHGQKLWCITCTRQLRVLIHLSRNHIFWNGIVDGFSAFSLLAWRHSLWSRLVAMRKHLNGISALPVGLNNARGVAHGCAFSQIGRAHV